MKRLTHYILLLLITVFFASCNDEVQYTTDFEAKISFSADTISFDTVFSTIGSSTKGFQVFNNNDKAIKLKEINLASGGASGFRINVDGQNGTHFKDIDILKKDSIFVFVEVTVNPQDADSPILVTDSLQFIMENGRKSQVILQAYGQDVIILKEKVIKGNTIFTADRPYLIYDELRVDSGAILAIRPGATLCFHSGASLNVYGKIKAVGTVDQPITFRGDRTDKMFTWLPYDRIDGQWGGIDLNSSSTDNVFYCVDIHGGQHGILCDSTGVENTKLTLVNSTIHNVKSYCIYSISNKLQIANSQLTNARYNCIFVAGGECEFYHTTIAQFYPWDGVYGEAVCFTNTLNELHYPIYGLNFYNCIVTGYNEDEINGNNYYNEDEVVPFNVEFNNCLIRTDTTGCSQYFNECVIDISNEDPLVDGEHNFKSINTEIYAYDFRLDSLSKAIGIGNPNYSILYPTDKNGKKRKSDHPDAGCYEF